MKVLVDTSVWIRSFRVSAFPAEAARLAGLLEQEAVAGHPFVYGELLIGATRERPLTEYTLMRHQLLVVPHDEVVAFVRAHRLTGEGVGWIDCHLLAAAVGYETRLWSADKPVVRAARHVGVAFEP
jgi:predicted nucleic acid-binding protein